MLFGNDIREDAQHLKQQHRPLILEPLACRVDSGESLARAAAHAQHKGNVLPTQGKVEVLTAKLPDIPKGHHVWV